MGKNTAGYFVNGTAALKLDRVPQSSADGSFVAFRSSARQNAGNRAAKPAPASLQSRIRATAKDLYERSEMACSLMNEDYHGVSYGLFTKGDIATISTACSIIAILAIAFGA